MLAAMARMHEDELRADLQQYYGIDFDQARHGLHTAGHVASLACQLPQDARVRVAENEDMAWTRELLLLASLVNQAHMDAWSAADKLSRGPQPAMVGPSWANAGRSRSLPAKAMPVSKLMEELSKPRKG